MRLSTPPVKLSKSAAAMSVDKSGAVALTAITSPAPCEVCTYNIADEGATDIPEVSKAKNALYISGSAPEVPAVTVAP